MKKNILLLIIAISVTQLQAQSIKFKKDKVLIDKEECLNYDKADANNLEISTLDGEQTVFLKFIRTGVGQNGGLYSKIIFVEEKKSMTSRSYIFTKKLLVKKLLSAGVLVDCALDEAKIDKFILKYDEGIEETLIRH